MKLHSMISVLVIAILVPAVAGAQEKKIICADNTIVTSDAACANRGGVQKPGGLNKVGKQINKAAIDTKDEVKRTPKNVEKGAKAAGHNVHEAAGDVSKGTQKAVHPKTYKANCADGTTWTGRTKKNACKDHGGVSNWGT
jgi:hypothetical protein